jgi:hypothetical protein
MERIFCWRKRIFCLKKGDFLFGREKIFAGDKEFSVEAKEIFC